MKEKLLIPYHPENALIYADYEFNSKIYYSYHITSTLRNKPRLMQRFFNLKSMMGFTEKYVFIALPIIDSLASFNQNTYVLFDRQVTKFCELGTFEDIKDDMTISKPFISSYMYGYREIIKGALPSDTFLLCQPFGFL